MMANEGTDSNPTPHGRDDSAQIKRKLAWHMGIAGAMIVALLGGLALFDYLALVPDETGLAHPGFMEPIPVPKKSVTQAFGPVVPASDEGAEQPGTSVPESTAAPVGQSAAGVAPSPTPEAAASPASGRMARQASRPSAVPLASSAGRAEQRGSPAGAGTSSRPDAPETAPHSPAGPQRPLAPPGPFSGYVFQAGVFADPRRAEDVHARLVQEGIPATLEIRVLVGPFKNQGDAESARAKMAAMGVDALPLPRSVKK